MGERLILILAQNKNKPHYEGSIDTDMFKVCHAKSKPMKNRYLTRQSHHNGGEVIREKRCPLPSNSTTSEWRDIHGSSQGQDQEAV